MNAEKEGAVAAEEFRHSNHLGVQPIGDLITVIEQATKIDVAVLDVGPDEHGLTMRDPARDAVFIGVARTKRPMRQRSTLVHELAHALFEDGQNGEPTDWSRRSPEEIRADAFARHLLLPVEGLHEFLGPSQLVGEAELSDVVQRFLVSPQIAAIALYQAGYIAEEIKEYWMNRVSAPKLAVRYGWMDQYEALAKDSSRRRSPQRLYSRAIAGYELGVLPAQALATLSAVPLADVEASLRLAGIEPPVEPAIDWASARDLAARCLVSTSCWARRGSSRSASSWAHRSTMWACRRPFTQAFSPAAVRCGSEGEDLPVLGVNGEAQT